MIRPPLLPRCLSLHADLHVECGQRLGHEGPHGDARGEVWWPQARTPDVVTVDPCYDDVFWEGVRWLDTL